jgi:hypothetical protein
MCLMLTQAGMGTPRSPVHVPYSTYPRRTKHSEGPRILQAAVGVEVRRRGSSSVPRFTRLGIRDDSSASSVSRKGKEGHSDGIMIR